MSDETIFDQNEVKEEKQGEEPLNNDETVFEEQQTPKQEETLSDKKKGIKTAGIAGAAGVTGAAIGVLTPINVFPDASEEGDDISVDDSEQEAVPSVSQHLQGHDMQVATGVNDSMSFNQAFAAARHEVGPGGLFVWHGHTYGTYYANEWNTMTPDEQNQYWADVHHTTSHIDYQPTPEPEPIPTPNPTSTPEPTPTPNNTETLELHEEDVMAVMDVDNDGEVDIAVVDVNHNGTPDIILDSTGDGKFDTLVLDPEMDEEGELIVNENNIHDIGGVNIIPSVEVNSAEPVNPMEENVLVFNESEVYGEGDLNEDGQVDTLLVDADGNENLDLVVDTTGDGNLDTLILDPGLDTEGNLVVEEECVTNIGGVVITPEQCLEELELETASDNQEVDELSSVVDDPDITIDNEMNMDDFVGQIL